MAITITKLKMWKNPGYTKGCVEVPPAGSKKLPAPDYTSTTNLRPRKNGTITAIELPLSFCQVFEMSYLYMEFQDNSNNQCKVFGWIDSIEQTASGEEAVLIRWDVDWWRSYSGSVTWGTGRITRCADASIRRPPTIQPRYNKFSKYAEITDSFNTIWCIVVYSDNSSGNTLIKTGVFPVGARVFGHTPENVLNTPTLKDCYNGLLDERFGIDPTAISGIWFSPICPCDNVSISSDSGGSYYDMHLATAGNSTIHNGYCLPWIDTSMIASHEVFISGTDAVLSTDDLTTFGVVDNEGALVGTFPWRSGIGDHDDDSVETAGFIQARVDVGATSCQLILRQACSRFFKLADSKIGASAGCMIKISLPSAPTNTNGMSSYLYSGQRQADIESAKIQQDQRFVNNLLGVGQGAITGGVGGAMASSNPVGAVAGASIGTGVALGSAFISNWAEGEFRDRLQGVQDKAHANQTPQLLIPGSGITWSNILPHPYIVKIEADSVTKSEYANMISNNGYETEWYGSPSTLISSGGAIQVTDLTITGSIPPQAKTSIKSMLEKGLRIVEKNPSGVTP